jgi:hypothetical protein
LEGKNGKTSKFKRKIKAELRKKHTKLLTNIPKQEKKLDFKFGLLVNLF